MHTRAILFTFFLSLALSFPYPVEATATLDLTNDHATLQFPDSITFSAQIQNNTDITSVVLEYGTDQLTCGSVVAKAFPDFTPSKDVNAEWTWEMKQSGSLPPGAIVWWQWQITDKGGHQAVSDKQTITWLDSQHDWQTLTGGNINLHWYSSGDSFGQELHDAAVQGLQRVERDAGLSTDQPVDMYIYANTQDMQDAILYEPSWTGGEAFPEFNIVIIGISPDEIDWGKNAEVHELTHVLVGHLTFSCLGDVPTWLNEGLAVYSEGQLDPSAQDQLDAAIQNDTLLSVRSLSGSFSEIASKANLSYSESYSLVKYLIDTYGREKMTLLLLALRDGATIDQALVQVYGFNIEGLEDYWRAAIGARPRAQVPNPTATPTATLVPTYVPFSGIPYVPAANVTGTPAEALITETPFPNSPSPIPLAASPLGLDPTWLIGIALIVVCGLGGTALVVGALIVAWRGNKRR
jgi:hypothetical protein